MFKIETHFRHTIFAIVLIKLIIAYFLPITSDEAYFFLWGQFPDIHYYDHPPMTGWVVGLFSLLGQHIFFSRLFTIISGLVIALGIHHLVRDGFNAPEKAKLVCLVFLVAPLHMLFVLITTDTALVLFVFLSGLTLFYALGRQDDRLMMLSGVFWGLAILSKYFAGLLLIAVFCCLVVRKDRSIIKHMLLWFGGALPFLLFHLYGNYQNCWTNILFNMVNRNKNVSWEISGLISFALFQIYLATPWALYFLIKNAKTIAAAMRNQSHPFLYLFAVPIALLGFVALHHTGLHWALAFHPFLILLLVHLSRPQIHRIVILSMVFSLVHVVPILTVLALPVETFQSHKYYHDLVLCKYGDELIEKIRAQYGLDYTMATNGYYTSGAMTYHSKTHVIVFMDHNKHGRHDDKLTDFRTLDGKNILVLATLPIKQDYSRFFDEVVQERVWLRNNGFYVVLGKGFRYTIYRELFLKRIQKDFYTAPGFLPKGDCYFRNMYFDDGEFEAKCQ